MAMGAWDGDTEKMSAQDFIRAFHRDAKGIPSKAGKAEAFRNYLISGSDIDDWFKTLPDATKIDMDLIDAAVEAQYPEEATVQPTAAEYGTELLRCKLTMAELGTRVKVADREVWAHHAWCTKILRLAMKAGVSATTTYIEQVRIELPSPLRTKIGKTHANWPAFIKAVRDVDTVELELEMKERREDKEKRDRLEKMLEKQSTLQASPTAGIRAQLGGTRISAPAATPGRWPATAPGASPFQTAGGGGQGNLFAAPRAPYQPPAPRAQQQQPQAPRAQYQAPRPQYQPQARPPLVVQQPLAGEQRRILVEAIARIPHHPDTEEGRRNHGAQQQQWYRVHGNVDMSVNTPYPLRPGRAPLNSGECFRCGFTGHTNYQRGCDAPQDQCISIREQQWRRIAWQALKEAPTGVNIVSFSSWDVDDYGRPFGGDEAHFEEVEEQGNA
ncbi:hypothetical protein C8R43DRAFT_1118677 [Mycena crocata]|nr:hypothetical protein C8R43DRAFT_1118677 [Mycena crocata]